jgi:hypothetical protein
VQHVIDLFLSLALAILPATEKASLQAAKILVGPNMLVSRDGDFAHVELMVAANPKNAKNLVGGAITEARPNGGQACRAYASLDGGSTWAASEFPEQVEFGGGDPQVAFTPNGTALFTGLSFVKDDKGQTRAALHVYRSEDGGLSWGKPADLGYSYDHEQIAVDQGFGKYAGRVYIGVLYGPYPSYLVGVFRSDDDGRTWTGPVEAASGHETIGINDQHLMVLSDGTLVVPYGDFEFRPEKTKSHGKATSNLWFVTSPDGGVTFSSPKKIVAQEVDLDERDSIGFPALAVDNRSEGHKDWLYVAWADARHGKSRVLFTRSSDRGAHWSAPVVLDGRVPEGTLQYQPVVAVNKDGVVAVTWFDTRDAKGPKQYHQYFAASTDGGQTFLPSVRISSAVSMSRGAGNSVLKPGVFRFKDGVYLAGTSAASRWGSGGDYMGLTSDKNGGFHPFWADARSGTFQIYTALVRVQTPPKPAAAGEPEPAKTAAASPPARVEVPIDERVDFVFDPTRYDAATKEIEYPIRLKNVSTAPIYPPIRLEVSGFGMTEYRNEDQKKEDAANAPSILHASNGKSGVGATLDFDGALGSLEALEPGALTGPVVLRMKLVDPEKTPSIKLKVTGSVAK